jgi:hypothetical protein
LPSFSQQCLKSGHCQTLLSIDLGCADRVGPCLVQFIADAIRINSGLKIGLYNALDQRMPTVRETERTDSSSIDNIYTVDAEKCISGDVAFRQTSKWYFEALDQNV